MKKLTKLNMELTKRETEVLRLLVQGKTNHEIAKELLISENTVKAHCKSIFEKLGVSRRVDAVVMALAKGIIWI